MVDIFKHGYARDDDGRQAREGKSVEKSSVECKKLTSRIADGVC